MEVHVQIIDKYCLKVLSCRGVMINDYFCNGYIYAVKHLFVVIIILF